MYHVQPGWFPLHVADETSKTDTVIDAKTESETETESREMDTILHSPQTVTVSEPTIGTHTADTVYDAKNSETEYGEMDGVKDLDIIPHGTKKESR